MLNEIREYEQYQEVFCSEEDINKFRLMPYVFFKKNHRNGLRRALTIVARKALENRNYFQTEDISLQKNIIDEVKDDLKIWCGFVETDERTTIKPWLSHYYELTNKTNEKFEKWGSFKRYFNSSFNKSFFQSALETDKNSIYEISYDGVIAEAIYFGKLKRYYLVCKKNGVDNFKVLDSDGVSYRPFDNRKKDLEKIDYIRKFVAAYLLKQKFTAYHNNYNIINNADLANWTQYSDIFKVTFFNQVTYKDKPIYEREPYWVYNIDDAEDYEDDSKSSKKFKKWQKCKPNENYISDYDFSVISEEEFDKDKLSEGYVFYSDAGSYFKDGKNHCFLCEGLEYKDMEKLYSFKC